MPAAIKACAALGVCVNAACALGGEGNQTPPSSKPSGSTFSASATATRIKATQTGGSSSGSSTKPLAAVDPNWQPLACWYEPAATPGQLKDAVDRLKKGGDLVQVTPTFSWGEQLMVDHYDKGKAEDSSGDGYKNCNVGKNGMFWRGLVNKDREDDPASALCERTLFWQNAHTLPKDEYAPTPAVLAAYAYIKINVSPTAIELKPAVKATVNVPTWV